MSKYRKYRKKFRFKRKYGTMKSRIYKNRKDIKMLKQGLEWKYSDYDGTGAANVNSTGATVCLNTLSKGTDNGKRVGEKVHARRLKIRGYFSNSHGTPEDAIARLVVFRARQPNMSLPSLANLFEDGPDVTTFRNMKNKEHYHVYYDHTFTMTVGSETGVQTYHPFKIDIKLNNDVTYTADLGTYADLVNQGLYIAYFSSVTGVDNCPLIVYRARFSYTDA